MSRPSDEEIAKLRAVAQEIHDSGDESGYLVGVATSQHRAFAKSQRPASALERELFLDAARRAGSREGLYIEEESGGLDLVAVAGTKLRKYRVKRGARTADGEYRFVCGAGSSLLTAETNGLITEERWILGYLSSDDHTVDEVIAAEVIGHIGDGPVTLLLGTIITLSRTPTPGGFKSTNEGLDGFGDAATDTGTH